MSGKRRNDDPDEDDDFSGEDNDFSAQDKMALERHRRSGKRLNDNEEELFAFDESDSGEEDKLGEEEAEDMESDIEGAKSDDDLPDVRAWGQSKRNYYSADYVDEDYGGLGAQEEEAAAMEEEEARNIQKRLVEQLEDADFSLDVFTVNKKPAQPVEKEETTKEQIKTDLRKLTKRQKLELLQKESPEFAGLLEEFKECVKKLHEQLEPLRSLIVDGTIPSCPAADFITTQHELVLNYCSNLSYYLLLKARRISVQAHPVVKRLVQYRQLVEQLQKNVSPLLEQQIENILELAAADKVHMEAPERPKKKLLKLLSKSEDIENLVKKQLAKQPRALKLQNSSASLNLAKDSDDSSQEEEEGGAEVDNAEENDDKEEGRRGITYQIAKNKGLTPYRKKELRNPRVKHRMKFRRAKIRRKGQIREVRAELKRYGGELSGIKAGVSKSVKLK